MDLSTQTGGHPATVTRPGSCQCQPGLIDANDPRRADVEAFIARRFAEVHGARINVFMPSLLALFDDQGAVRAAVGMRDAGEQSLFLEHYFDTSIEQVIVDRAGIAVARERIVEIGNLASIDRRASRQMFKLLAQHLHAEHFDWAVFTGCSSLHRMFAAIGIETVALGRALQSRLPVDQQTWGGYYEDNPQVVAGRIGLGRKIFDRLAAAA